jgi:molybdate transport system regulatory protein
MSRPRRAEVATKLLVRIKLQGGGVFGPGKAELLECVDRLGSISAAAREMCMSYRQAWKLIETMNDVFRERVVETSQGGAHGGGATLTNVGKKLLDCYRSMQQKATHSTIDDLETITTLLALKTARPVPKRPPGRRSV